MQVEPTYATARSWNRYTDGPDVGRAIGKWLGRRPTRWQQNALDVALERVDGPGSPYAFDEVIIIVGRRCGKTITTMGVPLARGLAGPVTLPNGRTLPFKATHTAQNLTAARQRFTEDLVEPFRRRFTDTEWIRSAEFKRAAADTTLTFDPRAGRSRKDLFTARRRNIASELRVLAPTPSSARGSGLLHLTWDEALTYAKERGEELAAAARPTMAEMHGHAQAWTVSNISTGTTEKMHLWHVREKGRAAVNAERTSGICYIEYSLPPDEDPEDERAWWRHYPGLEDGIVGINQLRRDREELGVSAFTAEYLCRWPDENPLGAVTWPSITERDWMLGETDAEQPTGFTSIGVDIDPFGRSSSIVAATVDPITDVVLVEVIDHRPGSTWVAPAVRDLATSVDLVSIDDYGPGHDLLLALSDTSTLDGKLFPTKSTDFISACYVFESRIRERRIRHRPHVALTAAAAVAERTTGKGWQWERRVSVSQAPLIAATLATWAIEHAPAVAPDSAIF